MIFKAPAIIHMQIELVYLPSWIPIDVPACYLSPPLERLGVGWSR